VNPEYYIIYPDDVASGPYATAEEARANVDEYQLIRTISGVKITRTIAVSSTKAAYTVDWNKPSDLGEDIATDFIVDTVTIT